MSTAPTLTLRSAHSSYVSPLIAQLPQHKMPNPLPACATCPAAMWRTTSSRIDCLCRNAGKISWDGRQEPTLFCDGREAAVAKLEAER